MQHFGQRQIMLRTDVLKDGMQGWINKLVYVAASIALSQAAGIAVLLAATLYALGKTFFWPSMLGVVAERFPKGGALTLNTGETRGGAVATRGDEDGAHPHR